MFLSLFSFESLLVFKDLKQFHSAIFYSALFIDIEIIFKSSVTKLESLQA